ncbi:MAG: peptidoglycan-binding domain-containing protein [Leptolyngbyaceae cyanobacterium]
METFAFTHVAVNYEDPNEAPSLREFDLAPVKKAAMLGAAGSAAVLAMTIATPDAHAMLSQGSKCLEVGALQRALNASVYTTSLISADTVFGPATAAKVTEAQTNYNIANPANKIVVDGKVGPQTARILGLTDWTCGGGGNNPTGSTTGKVTSPAGANIRTTRSTATRANIVMTLSQGTPLALKGTADITENGYTWVETRSGWWVASSIISRP